LYALAAGVEALAGIAMSERRKLHVAAVKLGVNAGLGVAGAVGAGFTFGISLILTAGGAAMIGWDGVDFARDFGRYQDVRRRLQQRRSELATLEAGLAAAVVEIERRSHR
jgi:hypothetical protein